MFGYPSGTATCLVAILLAGALSGCTLAVSPLATPRLPSQQDRARFGTIGITAAKFAPRDAYRTDAIIGKRAGARHGAADGAGEFILASILEGGPIGIILLPIMIPIGMAIGASQGEKEAVPDEVAAQIDSCIADHILSPDIQLRVRDRLVMAAEAETDRPFVLIDDQGPNSPEATVAYRNLAERGIDTVLEVSILEAGLAGGRGADPVLQPYFAARVRVVRVADDAEIFLRRGWYTAGQSQWSEWCAEDGKLLGEAVVRAHATMAEAIVEEVFLTWQAEPSK